MAGVVVVVVVKATGEIGEVTVVRSVGGNGVNINIVECEGCCSVVILLDVVKKLESSNEV